MNTTVLNRVLMAVILGITLLGTLIRPAVFMSQSGFTMKTGATAQDGSYPSPGQVTGSQNGSHPAVTLFSDSLSSSCRVFANGQLASVVLGQSSFTTNPHSAGTRGLYMPFDLATDSSGNLWVVDGNNNRVLEFVPPFSTGMAANLVIGQSDFITTTPTTTPNGLGFPAGVAFDSLGDLWVDDEANNRILEFVAPFSSGMSASLVIGQSSFTTFNQGILSQPEEVAFDPSGNLWVVDHGHNRVLEFLAPFSTGMAPSLVIGQPDFTTTAPATTQNGLSAPWGLAFDVSGNLWVADFSNSRVLEFLVPFSTGMGAFLVIGQSSFTTANLATTQNGLDFPLRVAFDSSGNLWVEDFGNDRVLEFLPLFSTDMFASFVIGQPNFTTATGATTQSGLFGPASAAFDPAGDLWVADENNNRVLEFVGTFTVNPSITSTPNSALVYTFVTVSGSCFAQSQTITMMFDGVTTLTTSPSRITSSSSGYFSAEVLLDNPTCCGLGTISATDSSSHRASNQINVIALGGAGGSGNWDK